MLNIRTTLKSASAAVLLAGLALSVSPVIIVSSAGAGQALAAGIKADDSGHKTRHTSLWDMLTDDGLAIDEETKTGSIRDDDRSDHAGRSHDSASDDDEDQASADRPDDDSDENDDNGSDHGRGHSSGHGSDHDSDHDSGHKGDHSGSGGDDSSHDESDDD